METMRQNRKYRRRRKSARKKRFKFEQFQSTETRRISFCLNLSTKHTTSPLPQKWNVTTVVQLSPYLRTSGDDERVTRAVKGDTRSWRSMRRFLSSSRWVRIHSSRCGEEKEGKTGERKSEIGEEKRIWKKSKVGWRENMIYGRVTVKIGQKEESEKRQRR